MPQTTPERSARWPGGDHEAIAYLRGMGWQLRRDWHWEPRPNYEMCECERDAIRYLIEEWDFGGVLS